MTISVERAGLMLADPRTYTDEILLHEAYAVLRDQSPVHLIAAPDYEPFYAVTRHADIMAIERDNGRWLNAPRPVLFKGPVSDAAPPVRALVNMDDPDHRVIRAIAADWFRPKAMRAMGERIQELAARYVDLMVEHGGSCDFVADVAVHYPLYVILSLLGLPEADFPRILKYSQEIFGSDDSETRRAGDDENAQLAVLMDLFTYFNELTVARRANPTEDLASTIANATVDGEYLSDVDAVGYYVIIATAGHDTTGSTLSGGLHALLTNPDQLARLRDDPALLPLAVEEMIRWVTPVKAFMRTAAADTSLRGMPISKGESVLLCYPSGNRDEEVYPDPYRFDVGRTPNHHLAFGFGAHYCLGAALARLELKALFAELLTRIDDLELAGQPEWLATTFVGGLKHLPISYRVR
jgi:cytochrome P450